GITTGGVGTLVAAYSLPGIVSALIVGPYSDRVGRRPFLVGGALIAGAFTILGAFAATFPLLVMTRGLAASEPQRSFRARWPPSGCRRGSRRRTRSSWAPGSSSVVSSADALETVWGSGTWSPARCRCSA